MATTAASSTHPVSSTGRWVRIAAALALAGRVDVLVGGFLVSMARLQEGVYGSGEVVASFGVVPVPVERGAPGRQQDDVARARRVGRGGHGLDHGPGGMDRHPTGEHGGHV